MDTGLDEIVKCVAEEIEHPVPGGRPANSCRVCSFMLLPAKPIITENDRDQLIQAGKQQGQDKNQIHNLHG